MGQRSGFVTFGRLVWLHSQQTLQTQVSVLERGCTESVAATWPYQDPLGGYCEAYELDWARSVVRPRVARGEEVGV